MYLLPHDLPISFDLPPDSDHHATVKRDSNIQKRDINPAPLIIIGTLSAFVFVAFMWLCLRNARVQSKSGKNKNASLLANWRLNGGAYQPTGGDDPADGSGNRPRVAFAETTTNGNNNSSSNGNTAGATIDRNTSIRSVITLPAYRAKASDAEQVIGREGERDGVDIVVEHLTQDEEERMREDEMNALYEVRMTRRQEITARDQRATERREARARNDRSALSEINSRARAATSNSQLEELRREHERIKTERQRTASSVSYGDLGVARHDGSRLRANSTESERVGLLSDAASIAVSTRSGAISPMPSARAPSVNSFRSVESDFPSPGLMRPRASSRPDRPHLNTSAASSPDLSEGDMGAADMPLNSPPGYDVVSLDEGRSGATTPYNGPPPDYPGPSQQRASRVAAEMANMADQTSPTERRQSRGSPSSASGAPQLPALQVHELPQIVVEPSSARPRDDR